LHARKAGIFPPKTHVGKLGNELALPGRIGAKRRRVSAQTFPSAILHFKKTIAAKNHYFEHKYDYHFSTEFINML